MKIVQSQRDYDACEFDDSSKFEVQVKGNLRGICTSGKASVHLFFIFSVIEAAYKLTFFAFPEPTLLRTIDQAGTCRIC